jgi:predicted transposase YbfD/YdcC
MVSMGRVFSREIRGKHVRIDGKILRGTRVNGEQILLVEAWDGTNLVGFESDSPGNEKAAVLRMVERLDLTEKVVTLDAGLSDNNILSAIVARGGSYVARVKGNKPSLCDSIEQAFAGVPCQEGNTDLAHGRIEVRESTVVVDPQVVDWIAAEHRIPELAAVGRTVRERTSKKSGKVEHDVCWFVIGQDVSASEYPHYVREHWEIEAMHCRVDVTLNEDRCHTRTMKTAVSLAVVRRLGLTVRKLLHPSLDHAEALYKCRFHPVRTFQRILKTMKTPALEPN